jgi:hypothetical protein
MIIAKTAHNGFFPFFKQIRSVANLFNMFIYFLFTIEIDKKIF